MTTSLGIYLTAFLVGLLGGVHCLSMCGGLVGSLTIGLDPRIRRDPWLMLPYQVTYNLARIAGYATAGAIFGGLGAMLLQLDAFHLMQRLLYGIAALVMILLGLYLGGWWRLIGRVERVGTLIWRRLEPYARRILPVRTPLQAAALGYLWAWIPCGLVYSVLITAMASGSVLKGILVMLAFGAGTLPNLLGIGLLAGAAARIAGNVWIQKMAGVLVIGFGAYALWQLLGLS